MLQWLLGLPKAMFVTLMLAIGILAIVLFNPPHTVCQSQYELFKKNQIGFLYPSPKSKFVKTSEFSLLLDRCKVSNSPGGCYELFSKLRRLLEDLDNVPDECNSNVSGDSSVKQAIWSSLDLLVRIGWGSKQPRTYYEKFRWLDTADMSLFCLLKKQATSFYGEDGFASFREKYFTELPGAKEIPRQSVWDSTILSENCKRYP